MNKHVVHGLLCAAGLVALSSTAMAVIRAEPDFQIGTPLNTTSRVLIVSDAWTGFRDLCEDSIAARGSTLAAAQRYDDPIGPFLYSAVKGRAAWKVTYDNMSLVFDSTADKAETAQRWLVEVWLDSATSQLLVVRLRPADTPAVRFRMPTEEEAKRQLRHSMETYAGLPDTTPGVSLVSVLLSYGRYVQRSKDVIVQYVTYSRDGSVPCPAWSVYLRGGPSSSLHGLPHTGANRRRVFDATTGRSLCPEVNMPYAELEVDSIRGGGGNRPIDH